MYLIVYLLVLFVGGGKRERKRERENQKEKGKLCVYAASSMTTYMQPLQSLRS